MGVELPEWPRPNYTPGGGSPLLLYVVFGQCDAGVNLSASQYQCDGIPAGIQLAKHSPDSGAETVDLFRQGYLWDELQTSNPALADAVAQTSHCATIRGGPTDDTNLNYLRNSLGLVTWLLDNGGCCAYDPQMLQYYSPHQWRKEVFEAGASPHRHVVILVSEETDEGEPRRWYHTRGMRKYGRPDISIHNVLEADADVAVQMCQRLIAHQASGAVVPEGQVVKLAGGSIKATAHHAGDLDDPDFNNVHLELMLET